MLRRLIVACVKTGGKPIRRLPVESRRAFRVFAVLRQCGGTARVRYIRAMQATEEAYRTKNRRLGRPLSPALFIYKKQLTSVLSITNRLSALYLSGQLAAAGLACIWACRNKKTFDDLIKKIESWKLENRGLFIMKLMLVLPFVYHLVLGTRHLLWDSGRFLTIREVYKTGYIALVVILLLTLGLAGFGMRKDPPNSDRKKPKL